jgi:hypothetical protein
VLQVPGKYKNDVQEREHTRKDPDGSVWSWAGRSVIRQHFLRTKVYPEVPGLAA